MRNAIPKAWHSVDPASACEVLGSHPDRGLGASEVALRLARDRMDALAIARPKRWWATLLAQFHAPLVYLLVAAALVMFFLGDHVDGGVILGVVAINAAIGFVQERRAIAAIDSLARTIGVEATVVRGENGNASTPIVWWLATSSSSRLATASPPMCASCAPRNSASMSRHSRASRCPWRSARSRSPSQRSWRTAHACLTLGHSLFAGLPWHSSSPLATRPNSGGSAS